MNRFRRSAFSYSAVLAAACASSIAAAAPVETYSFSIPTQDLDSALRAFARQARQQVIFDGAMVQDKTSAALVGSYTADDALQRLLADSGLKATRGEPGVVMVRLASSAAPQADATHAGADSGGVEEVIVSAQKRGEERLQDVPVPVTAIDAQRLADNGQMRLRDYFSSIPGLSLSPDISGYQNIAIRGITTGRASIPTTGLMIDDVPFGMSIYAAGSMPDIDPSDLARVEILRGPQGTLYGANSMGGLVRYVTVDPSTDRYRGQASINLNGVRNGDQLGHTIRASGNIPLTDTLALRASGFTRREPGYVDNPVLGTEGVNTIDASGGLLTALWRSSETLSLRLSAVYQQTHGDGSAEVDVSPGMGDLQQNLVPGAGPYDRTVEAYSAHIKAQWGRIQLDSITGYNVNHVVDAYDSSGIYRSQSQTFGVSRSIGNNDTRSTKFAQELRFSAPIGPRLEVFGGVFYTDEHFTATQFWPAVTDAGEVVGTIFATDDFVNDYEEYAAFANVTYRFTDRFDVQVGGRHSDSTAEQPANVYTGIVYRGRTEFPALEASTEVFTYLVTPRFKLSPDLMMYARLASGYRPGLFNPNANVLGVPESFKSDNIRNYEIGVKGDFLDGKLALDASVYYIDWQDLQLQVSNSLGISYRTNGSGAKSEGIELSVIARPLHGMTLNAWIDYDNAVLTEAFPAGSPVTGRPGDRLPFSSRRSGNVSLQQEFSLAPLAMGLTGFVNGSASYVDDRFGNFRGATPARQSFPAYTKVDFSAGVKYDEWAASLYINNLADRRGILSEGFYPPYRTIYIQPRTVGLTVVRSF